MSNQRPAWFRLSSIAMRPPVPPPAPTLPPPPPAPPTFQIRPPAPPLPPAPRAPVPQNPTPGPPPVSNPAAPPPAAAPQTPPAPRAPVVQNPTPGPSPRPSPVPTPPRNSPVTTLPPAAAPQTPVATRSPVVQPPVVAAATPQRSPPNSPNNPSNSPKTKAHTPAASSSSSSSSSKQSTPAQKPAATPISSPKTIKANPENSPPPSQSPKMKALSPLTLPPPQIKTDEPEQKHVLVHKPTMTKAVHNPTHHVASKGKKEPTTRTPRSVKKVSEEFGMRVVTLAGENRGAIMELTPSHNTNKKNNKSPAGTGRVIGSSSVNGIDHQNGEEGKSKNNEKSERTTTMPQPMSTSYFNSNVQGVNNSILFNTNCRHNDPGIHISLARKPNNGDRNHRTG